MVLKPCGGDKGVPIGGHVVKGKKSGRGKDAGARLPRPQLLEYLGTGG